ncbi:hypothetical protein HK100_002929 [Physocladia obscura]|uniref:Uncharacterized protein n=1 Tax=Physocladia obscura TaxID=109957 RepID=A0AAD5TBF6_9FUNG|nr:hypothetical protein HK100_002929 [Physocladia obscura]
MATIQDLHDQFEKFCAFGRGSISSSLDSIAGGSTMDGGKWAKFARDSNLIDNKKITSTEIDIIFNKVKAKNSRRINWDEFLNGVKLISAKKYPERHVHDAFTQVMYDVCVKAHGPVASNATAVKNDAVLDRLTNVSGYTGTHKARFDSAGHGLGLQGRDTSTKTDQLSKIVNRGTGKSVASMAPPPVRQPSATVTKRPSVLTKSEEQLENITNSPKKTPVAGRRATQVSVKSKNYTTASTSSLNKNAATSSSKASVFDRLTDSSGYTGAHKHRFNVDGTGRGIAGRDLPSLGSGPGTYRGGDVKSLSQILRN